VKVKLAGSSKEGFVTALSSEAEFKGQLSEVIEVVSSLSVLRPHIYQLLKAVAARQCASVGELIDNAVPGRAVRVEKAHVDLSAAPCGQGSSIRKVITLRPHADKITGRPMWLETLSSAATAELELGRSVIVCLPDFRDIDRFESVLKEKLHSDQYLRVDSSGTNSERYSVFLSELQERPVIVFGTRNVLYSPASANSTVFVWDDGDQSHTDQQSPYISTRELALVRQSVFKCDLYFYSHARSTDIQRLIEIGYLTETPIENWRPKVSKSDSSGLDGLSFKAIKVGLESGPVLVQVASPGVSKSLFCAECSTRSTCSGCNGPLWVNARSQISCRWCGNLNLNAQCRECGAKEFRQGGAGVTRWVTQLGKSFPGVPVYEVTREDENTLRPSKPAIYVATPGIEPIVSGGYSAAVFLDGATLLGRDSLRSSEDALRGWLNALAFVRSSGESVVSGISSEIERALTLGEISETIKGLLAERQELGFPPAKRFLSATGRKTDLDKFSDQLSALEHVKVLGIAAAVSQVSDSDYRLVASFPYAQGHAVVDLTRAVIASTAGKQLRVSAKSGRNLRPLTIKFDDPRVI
jgi:primosomal protein N' (replication factor Y)